MRTNFKQRPEWQWGELGARRARRWFQEQGCFVVPVDAIENGGAPALLGQLERYVLPDMQVVRAVEARWVEVKWKTAPDLYRVVNRWRHGVDLPNWRAYLAVECLSGIPGYLAIFEFKPGPDPDVDPDPHLLLASFADLRLTVQEQENGKPPMAWFDRDRFDRFPMDLDSDEMPDLILRPRLVHPWERKGAVGPAPRAGPKQEVMPW